MNNPCWQPTPDEIRECCGVFVDCCGNTKKMEPRMLTKADVEELETWTKIEPIPEQCVPKPAVPEERYLVRYPLLAGILI